MGLPHKTIIKIKRIKELTLKCCFHVENFKIVFYQNRFQKLTQFIHKKSDG